MQLNNNNESGSNLFFEYIEIFNFRIYYGSNKFEFGKDKNKNLNFIKTGNSAGKTTLLKAIVWCIWGENYLRDKMNEGQLATDGIKSLINDRSDENRAKVSLKITINKESYLLTRSINLDESDQSIRELKNLQLDPGKEILSENDTKNFINKYFGDESKDIYFAFEGERLETFFENLFQTGKHKDVIENTILTLSNFELLRVAKSYSNLTNDYIGKLITAESTDAKLEELDSKVEKARTARELHSDAIEKSEQKADSLNKSLRERRSNLERENPDLNIEVNEKKENIQRLLAEEEKKLALLKKDRNELIFKQIPQMILSKFINKFDRKNITNKIENLEQSQDIIIYNRIINDIINDGSHNIPNSDINLISQDSFSEWKDNNIDIDIENIPKDLEYNKKINEIYDYFSINDVSVKDFKKLLIYITETKEAILNLEIENSNITPQRVSDAIKSTYKVLANDESKYEDFVQSIEVEMKGELKVLSKNVRLIEEERNEARLKFASNSQTQKKLEIIGQIVRSTDIIYRNMIDEMTRSIFIEASRIYSRIWTGKDDTFELKAEELGIVILDAKTNVPLSSPSAGHQQIAALSFLTSAYNVAGNKNPFIFDYIFARLDTQRQTNLIKELPKLGHQFIISVLTSEPNWDSNPDLFEKINKNVNKKYTLDYDINFPNSRVAAKEIN